MANGNGLATLTTMLTLGGMGVGGFLILKALQGLKPAPATPAPATPAPGPTVPELPPKETVQGRILGISAPPKVARGGVLTVIVDVANPNTAPVEYAVRGIIVMPRAPFIADPTFEDTFTNPVEVTKSVPASSSARFILAFQIPLEISQTVLTGLWQRLLKSRELQAPTLLGKKDAFIWLLRGRAIEAKQLAQDITTVVDPAPSLPPIPPAPIAPARPAALGDPTLAIDPTPDSRGNLLARITSPGAAVSVVGQWQVENRGAVESHVALTFALYRARGWPPGLGARLIESSPGDNLAAKNNPLGFGATSPSYAIPPGQQKRVAGTLTLGLDLLEHGQKYDLVVILWDTDRREVFAQKERQDLFTVWL